MTNTEVTDTNAYTGSGTKVHRVRIVPGSTENWWDSPEPRAFALCSTAVELTDLHETGDPVTCQRCLAY
jgi:hypothetical protein